MQNSYADGSETNAITAKDVLEIKHKLDSFEKGTIGLDEATGVPDKCDKVVDYFLLHSNEVSVKMKLPISRSFAILGKYPEAARLAQEYINVYSNDWHGWRVLGGAKGEMHLYDQAVSAYTNAARLGDEENYPAFGLAAWAADRLDILRDMVVPHLFVLREDKTRFPKDKRLDMTIILVGYSLRADKQDVFVKALKDVDAKDILSRKDLKQMVTIGCTRFKGADIDKIRQELKAAEASNSNSATNSLTP